MSFKTILVHVDEGPRALVRVNAALRLAQSMQARLVGLASTGADRYLSDAVVADAANPGIAGYLAILRQRARMALDQFEAAAGSAGIKEVESRQSDADAGDADAGDALAAMGAYCDLCVLGHYGRHLRPDGQGRQLAADVAAGGGCPVLLLPDAVAATIPFRRILLGWNGSAEAARALHFSMPLLLAAGEVAVMIAGDALDSMHGLSPAAEIGDLLRRHGIDAAVLPRREAADAGQALLATAAERRSDLIVTGCYGHARVREWLLGGATRQLLMSEQIPMFMAA